MRVLSLEGLKGEVPSRVPLFLWGLAPLFETFPSSKVGLF